MWGMNEVADLLQIKMNDIFQFFATRYNFILIAGVVIFALLIFSVISPSRTKSRITSNIYNGLVFLVAFCVWAIGAFITYTLAHFSINQTVINIVLLSCFIFLVIALIFIYKQKYITGVIIAVAPLPIFMLLVTWLIPTVTTYIIPLFETDSPEFIAACKGAGVKLLDKPVAPVRSIAYDFDPKRISNWSGASRIELDNTGRTIGFGGFSKHNSVEAKKKLNFEFTERRAGDGAGFPLINPSASYYHFATGRAYYGVDNLSADVLAFLDVDNPVEYSKAPISQGVIRYQITLTDRRSGAILGVQVFVVDRLNHRACGVNVDNTISPSAFVFDAINR